jgi:3-oxoacyl-[acyl-carrier protein] reductase
LKYCAAKEFPLEISGAVALVTGGCGGLGLPIAEYLHGAGARVVVVDRDEEALSRLPKAFGRRKADLVNPEEARAAAKSAADEYGGVDILVNAAGAIVSEPFANIFNAESMMLTYERFRAGLTVNLDTVFIMTAAVVEHMVLRRTRGVIVSLSSVCACGNEGQTAYSAAKAAVNAMTVTWSKELGRLGIRCNAVAPGFIDTPSTRAALNEAQLKHIVAETPLRRLGLPFEVAQATAALIENDFLNGVVLPVNGGLTL